MTVIVTEDFDYADLAAMTAGGWSIYNGVYDTAIFGVGGGAATVTLPDHTTVHDFRHFDKTYTGLTPGATYTIALDCGIDFEPVLPGDVVAGYDNTDAGLQTLGGDGSGRIICAVTGNQTLTKHTAADAAGEILVTWGQFYTAGFSYRPDRTITAFTLTIADGAPAPVFTSALPIRGDQWDWIAYTAGVITIGGVPFGFTRGALRFDPGEVWAPQEYDGDFVPVVGTQELVSQRPRFLGSFLPVGPRELARYLPKSTQAVSLDTTVVTPTVPGTALVAGDYSLDVTVTWPYLSGGTIAVTFPYAFWQKYGFDGADKGEVLIPCEILGVPLTTTTAPYYITVTEPGDIS